MLLDEVKRWGGPVSAAVYFSKESHWTKFLTFIVLNDFFLQSTAFHAYVERNSALEYPHNILRNLAMDQLQTDYFLALDVDFVTERDCYSRLVNLVRTDLSVKHALQSKTFLVLPAFESFADNATVPESKREVLSMVEGGQASPFHIESFKPGHQPTNFDRWYSNETGALYDIQYDRKFEPYVIGQRYGFPRYWDAFRGYHYTKLSWFIEANLTGCKFAVLRDFFVFHKDKSIHKNKEMSGKNFEDWNRFVYFCQLQCVSQYV
jgi:glycosyltransferase-like protein LARGE